MPVKKLTPQNFQLVSGNDKTLNFTTTDQDGKVVDLTSATLIWAFSRKASNKARLVTYTSPTNVTITDATAGLFSVSIQAADTEGLPGADYYHEVRMANAAGLKFTLVIGIMTLLDNIIDV